MDDKYRLTKRQFDNLRYGRWDHNPYKELVMAEKRHQEIHHSEYTGQNNFHINVHGNELHVELTYPPRDDANEAEKPGQIRYVVVDQESVRASDGVRLHYDYQRDGFVIEQASRFSWATEEESNAPMPDLRINNSYGDLLEPPRKNVWGKERSIMRITKEQYETRGPLQVRCECNAVLTLSRTQRESKPFQARGFASVPAPSAPRVMTIAPITCDNCGRDWSATNLVGGDVVLTVVAQHPVRRAGSFNGVCGQEASCPRWPNCETYPACEPIRAKQDTAEVPDECSGANIIPPVIKFAEEDKP